MKAWKKTELDIWLILEHKAIFWSKTNPKISDSVIGGQLVCLSNCTIHDDMLPPLSPYQKYSQKQGYCYSLEFDYQLISN